MKRKLTPHRAWMAFFAIWSLFLTGLFSGFDQKETDTRKKIAATAPGILQYFRLSDKLVQRRRTLAETQELISSLEKEMQEFETNPAAQERAIRAQLGYSRPDELLVEIR